jgi:hypothetical protein
MKTTDSAIQPLSQAMYGEAEAASAPSGKTPQIAADARRRITREASAARPPRAPRVLPPPPPEPSKAVNESDSGVTRVRLQGIGIKTKYTLKEVLSMSGDSLRNPVTSFVTYMANAGSLLIDGKPATQEQKDSIARVTSKFDAIVGLAPTNGQMQLAGKILHRINDAAHGKSFSREEMASDLMDGVSTVDVKLPDFKATSPGRLDGSPVQSLAVEESDSKTAASDAGKEPVSSLKQEVGKEPVSLLKQLVKRGPPDLVPAANRQADQQRIDAFFGPVSFYRKDRAVSAPDFPSVIHATEYKDRRNVLTVGKGKDLAFYGAEAKAGSKSGKAADMTPELANASVIKLGSGNDGVAAVNVSFKDLAPGSTTIVSGGPMRGSTMLFTADESGFSAYHAGWSKHTRAKAADAEASSIAEAHERFGSAHADVTPPQNGMEALYRAATSHPFSAIVSSYGDPPAGQPHPKFAPSNDAGLGADGRPWSMMNFNYVSADQSPREVGTAEAIIRKDRNGKMTVQVLAERGKLDYKPTQGMSTLPTDLFNYRQLESAVGRYSVDHA